MLVHPIHGIRGRLFFNRCHIIDNLSFAAIKKKIVRFLFINNFILIHFLLNFKVERTVPPFHFSKIV
jgi:hypothetical protein